jgi:hypothetical protein
MTDSITVAPPASTRDARTDAAYAVLAAAWAQTTDETEPDWLRAVADTLDHDDECTTTLPDPDTAHHMMVAALAAAHDAHLQAIAQQAATEQDWHTFRADVRRRAADAVNAGHICRDGTNAALREFGIDELRVEYRVDLLVPVTVYARAADPDQAYEQAADRVRDDIGGDGLDIDTDDLRHDDTTVTDEDVD